MELKARKLLAACQLLALVAGYIGGFQGQSIIYSEYHNPVQSCVPLGSHLKLKQTI